MLSQHARRQREDKGRRREARRNQRSARGRRPEIRRRPARSPRVRGSRQRRRRRGYRQARQQSADRPEGRRLCRMPDGPPVRSDPGGRRLRLLRRSELPRRFRNRLWRRGGSIRAQDGMLRWFGRGHEPRAHAASDEEHPGGRQETRPPTSSRRPARSARPTSNWRSPSSTRSTGRITTYRSCSIRN